MRGKYHRELEGGLELPSMIDLKAGDAEQSQSEQRREANLPTPHASVFQKSAAERDEKDDHRYHIGARGLKMLPQEELRKQANLLMEEPEKIKSNAIEDKSAIDIF